MVEIKGLNEECGVFAVSNNENALSLCYYGIHSLQHRGQEAAGIAFNYDNVVEVIKNPGLVSDVFSDDKIFLKNSKNAIGHVRYASADGQGIFNVQPFSFRFFDETISLAHNGHIGNAKLLKQNLEAKGSVFSSTSDSEILIHLLRHEQGDFISRLKDSLIKLDGSFAYVLLHDSGVYGIRDRHGLRPLSIGKMSDDSYILSSESCAFSVIGAEFIRDVNPGEIVWINGSELVSTYYANDCSHNLCLMEYVYFSRPDSTMDGSNVHFSRKRCGKTLSMEAPIVADIVVGVPDSSTSAAIGYAEATGIPFELGLIKNKYVGRTFIQPTQALREKGVKMKLSAVREIVAGKKILLVDDSIVRGTTSKRIVRLLKDAGALEVHVRIASPAIKFPCYYGVDISTFDELISNRLDVEELRDFIKADSLAFLSLEGLKQAILDTKVDEYTTKERYCDACFSGEYTTTLYESLDQFNINKEDL